MRIFPFAPGIPWKFRNNVLVPRISGEYWHKLVQGRDLVVTCFSGLFESYFSLSFLEALNQIVPQANLFWAGNSKFDCLRQFQGLARPFTDITQDHLDRFPIPIFWDKNNRTYFNACCNYPNRKNILGVKKNKTTGVMFDQIFRNLMLLWKSSYNPQLRNYQPRPALLQWIKVNQLDSRPFVLIVPGETKLSQRNEVFLKWSPNQVKALAAILAQQQISTVVLTNTPGQFADFHIRTWAPDPQDIPYLLPRAKAILSKEMDYLYLGLLTSPAQLIGRIQLRSRNPGPILKQNAKWLELPATHPIYIKQELSVMEAAEQILKS